MDDLRPAQTEEKGDRESQLMAKIESIESKKAGPSVSLEVITKNIDDLYEIIAEADPDLLKRYGFYVAGDYLSKHFAGLGYNDNQIENAIREFSDWLHYLAISAVWKNCSSNPEDQARGASDESSYAGILMKLLKNELQVSDHDPAMVAEMTSPTDLTKVPGQIIDSLAGIDGLQKGIALQVGLNAKPNADFPMTDDEKARSARVRSKKELN